MGPAAEYAVAPWSRATSPSRGSHRLSGRPGTKVFAYPGDGINGILAAWGCADNGPTFIQARHEEMAAFEAVRYATFTGGLGVCMATSGSGPARSGSYAAVSQAIPAGRHGPAGTRSG